MRNKFLSVILFLVLGIFLSDAHAEEIRIINPSLKKDRGITLSVEIALNNNDRAKGLMFRTELDDFSGMLFVFPEDRQVAFWMKNTLIPLDMLFIDATGMIVHIHKMAKPKDLTKIPSPQPIRAVLEINGGMSEKLGILEGNRLFPEGLIKSLEVQ
ncbi:MAG TPA: DUF192 domain-containing protein [Alphaproteobacteria bacterium]|nr:DUF192 domain-containing protein [Alphaproteobacteria bacterium]HOO50926.1 DUF192 domain-containing protein [Alphaproteobacteria bacterium]